MTNTDIEEHENLEARDQDPIRSTQTSEARELKSTEFQVSMNLFKVFVGIGVLSLGYGIKLAGLIQANMLMIVGASFTYWSINILITIVETMNGRINSFDELSSLLLGQWGSIMTKLCVIILQVGTCVTYVYYFGVFFRNMFCFLGFEAACEHFYISLVLVLFLIIPLQMIRTLTKYWTLSLIANFLIMFSLLSVTVYLSFWAKDEENLKVGDNLFDWQYFPAFFGISIFSIESLSIILEIRDSMQNPLLFRAIFKRQFTITLVLYTVLPTIFYLILGDQINEIILFNIPIENPLGLTVQICYGIALILSYPLQMYPVFLIIERFVRRKTALNLLNNSPEEERSQKFRYKIKWISIRVMLCLFLVVMAYVIPDFAWFLNVLGAIGSTILGMILPVVLAEKYFIVMGMHKELYPPFSRYGNLGTMIIGIVGGGMATYYSLDYMIGKP